MFYILQNHINNFQTCKSVVYFDQLFMCCVVVYSDQLLVGSVYTRISYHDWFIFKSTSRRSYNYYYLPQEVFTLIILSLVLIPQNREQKQVCLRSCSKPQLSVTLITIWFILFQNSICLFYRTLWPKNGTMRGIKIPGMPIIWVNKTSIVIKLSDFQMSFWISGLVFKWHMRTWPVLKHANYDINVTDEIGFAFLLSYSLSDTLSPMK